MQTVILECKNIHKRYKKKGHDHIAADNITFKLYEGECLGIVGESGCGKSTLAKMIMNLESVDAGQIMLMGEEITNLRGKSVYSVYKKIQMVFQDVIGSFDPKMTIGESIMEYICSLCSVTRAEREQKLEELLSLVGLPAEFKNRYPHQISGGQCQRAAIARALSSHPRVMVFDEATSALDVSIQAQVIQLLKTMKEKFNMSYLFITHDLALTSHFCDRILVMKDGKVVEEGKVDDVLNRPQHEYTKCLLNAVL